MGSRLMEKCVVNQCTVTLHPTGGPSTQLKHVLEIQRERNTNVASSSNTRARDPKNPLRYGSQVYKPEKSNPHTSHEPATFVQGDSNTHYAIEARNNNPTQRWINQRRSCKGPYNPLRYKRPIQPKRFMNQRRDALTTIRI